MSFAEAWHQVAAESDALAAARANVEEAEYKKETTVNQGTGMSLGKREPLLRGCSLQRHLGCSANI